MEMKKEEKSLWMKYEGRKRVIGRWFRQDWKEDRKDEKEN